MSGALEIRALRPADAEPLSAAFAAIGWSKPVAQYRRYLTEQEAGTRDTIVAAVAGQLAGYVTLNRRPTYPPFVAAGIPEIQDLNVLPPFRRRGIGSRLVKAAERAAGRDSRQVGLGVGLHAGYGAAQRLYVRSGYVPDGRGVTYRDRPVEEGEKVVVDDHLVVHMTKELDAPADPD